MKKVYIIAGPTAVGKTDIAAAIAARLHTAVVSADSRQCYREMTIGTAKPPDALLNRVKHYFIDAFPVTDWLTAADFESLALQYLDEIFLHHEAAVVCGGTGLYIQALAEGLDEMPPTTPAIVEAIDNAYKQNGLQWLQDAVSKEDPAFYATAEVNNPARLMRALAFIRSNRRSINDFKSKTVKQRPFEMIRVGLELPREVLYDRINTRVDMMMQEGLLAEVRQLYHFRHLKNLQTVGYTELFDHLEGKCTLPEAVDKIKQHTRNYAKRQMTWFKKDNSINWFDAADSEVTEKILALGQDSE